MAALLSGMVVSHEEEKLLLTDSSCGVVVMENNNKQVTNCPDGDVAREALQNPEPQVKIMYDSSPCESENFVLSGKDSNEHNSGLKEAESRMDEQKKVSIYGTYIITLTYFIGCGTSMCSGCAGWFDSLLFTEIITNTYHSLLFFMQMHFGPSRTSSFLSCTVLIHPLSYSFTCLICTA
jgi:hypothetical protein